MEEAEIKKLTWKYFWKQKAKEVGWGILGLTALAFIPYLMGKLFLFIIKEGYLFLDEGFMIIWVMGLFWCAVLILFGFIIFNVIVEWIKSNWEKAQERANNEAEKEELKKWNELEHRRKPHRRRIKR